MTQPAIDIEHFRLSVGSHRSIADGACVVELASYIAGRPFSDRPQCVSPAIGEFLRICNDSLNDDDRQMLLPYAYKAVGTATTAEDELRRAWMATDWLVRVFAPAWLDLAGLSEYGSRLRALPELTTDELATVAQSEISAAESAAWSSARSAAKSAARSAAKSAAWSAAKSAAWSAAESAARSAAGSAAGSAAKSALAPTVATLQKEALLLLDKLCDVGREVAA